MAKVSLINTYKKYPTYKDSGVKWLGEIPKDWEVLNLQWLYQKLKRTGFQDEELLSVYRDRGVIKKSSRNDNHNKASEDLSTYQLVNKGDLAINKMKAWQGSLAISPYQGIVSPAYYVCRPLTNNNPRFIHYLLRSKLYIKQYEQNSGGVRNNQWDLRYESFRKIEAVIPPKEEQEKIAKFLDEQTARIDESITKKQRLIELLKEKRTSFINKKITEATGEKLKLKQCFDINPPKRLSKTFKDNEVVAFVPMEAISDTGELLPQERKYLEVKSGFTYFENNDVVLAKITPCFENGKAGVMKELSNGFGFGTTEFVVMRPKENILPEYLYYVIYSNEFREKGEVEMRGTAGQKRVSASFVKNYLITLPILKNQQIVVDEIRNKLDQYHDAEEKLVRSIDKLKEFKSSLISHAVTGKIKV